MRSGIRVGVRSQCNWEDKQHDLAGGGGWSGDEASTRQRGNLVNSNKVPSPGGLELSRLSETLQAPVVRDEPAGTKRGHDLKEVGIRDRVLTGN